MIEQPESDLFIDEGVDRCWAWAGNHDEKQARSFARNECGISGPIRAVMMKCNIELHPGEISDKDPYIFPHPKGKWEFWLVEGV